MNFSKHWAATLDDYAIDVAWSPDGKILAAASAAGGITLFNHANGVVLHELDGHLEGANCLAWKPTPRTPSAEVAAPQLLASGGQDGHVRFWDPVTGVSPSDLKLGSAWVEHLGWQPVVPASAAASGGPLLFASAGKKLVALRADGSLAHAFADAPKSITALAWRADGTACAVAYFGGVCVWDATTFAVQKEFPYGNTIHALTWSPDGRWLVAGCQDNAVHLWAPAEDVELHMSGYETKLKELSFSYDSKWLATGGGQDACIWDCEGAGPEGRTPLQFPHKVRVCATAFQHTHGLLATAAVDGEFCLWSPSRKNPLVAEVKMPSPAAKFAWRADDALLAVGTERGNIFVFKTE